MRSIILGRNGKNVDGRKVGKKRFEFMCYEWERETRLPEKWSERCQLGL